MKRGEVVLGRGQLDYTGMDRKGASVYDRMFESKELRIGPPIRYQRGALIWVPDRPQAKRKRGAK